MYKVVPVQGGWRVFFIEEGKPPQPDVGRVKPYSQKTHAYRRARTLNKKLKEVEERIARDGAILA